MEIESVVQICEAFRDTIRSLSLNVLNLISSKINDIMRQCRSEGAIDVAKVESLVIRCQILLKMKMLLHRESIFTQEFSNIAIVIANLCHISRVPNSKLVCGAIKCVHEIVGHFDDFHNMSRRRLFLGETIGDIPPNSDTSVLDYFLEHSNKERMIFDGDFRFIDIIGMSGSVNDPYLFAMRKDDPEFLLFLLRNGFDVSRSGVNKVLSTFSINIALIKSLVYAIAHPGLSPRHPKIECAKIILRSVDILNLRDMGALLASLIGASRNINFTKLFIKKASAIAPELEYRYISAPNLKHICRCKIRKVLMENWNLPSGIYSLEIPDTLKSYLDLLDD